MITLYHVEYSNGMIMGRFFNDGSYASWAQDKANETGRPTKVSRVTIKTDAQSICDMLNDRLGDFSDDAMQWGEEEMFYPEGS